MGEIPSIVPGDMVEAQKVVAKVPSLEVVLQVERVAGCTDVPMVAFQEVGLFAPMVELNKIKYCVKKVTRV